MSDEAFLQVLAGCSETCANMDLSDDGWSPPDGKYTVILSEVATGSKEKNGVNNIWIKPVFTILDGEFEGKTFNDFFYLEGVKPDEPTIPMKNMCRLASCLAGTETRNLVDANKIINGAVGELLSVEVYRTTSKKTGREYANIRFLQKLETTEEETTEAK